MSYNADDLEKIDGVDAVRQNAGMYTALDTEYGCHHLFAEGIDNGCDEIIAGHADSLFVKMESESVISFRDNGRGMPVDMNKKTRKSGVEMILTELHAGGKFNKKNYAVSGGLHGVGCVVMNAMAEWLEVKVWRDGQIWFQRYNRGKPEEPLKTIGKCAKKETGTEIMFRPDPEMYESPRFNPERVRSMLLAKAILLDGCTIYFEDFDGNKETLHFENGLKEYCEKASPENRMFVFSGTAKDASSDDISLSWCFMPYEDDIGDTGLSLSYVNTIPTTRGGTHKKGFERGFLKAVVKFADERGMLGKNIALNERDIFTNVSYGISLFFDNIQFSSQTKEELISKTARTFCEKVIQTQAELWLNENFEQVKEWLDIVIARANARARRAKKEEQVELRDYSGRTVLPGKLSDCTTKNRKEAEIFLVEGDSAGGSAKQARDRTTQAIMALKGKILNTQKTSRSEAMKSEPINDIVVALGTGYGDSFDISKCRYGKIIQLTDADVDGSHIRCLLSTMFNRIAPELLRAGMVYIAQPPLYRVDIGKEHYYALDETQLEKLVKKAEKEKKEPRVMRFKGLGEMSPDQLRETVMNPENRILVQVLPDDEGEFDSIIEDLMGDDSSKRRKFLEDYID